MSGSGGIEAISSWIMSARDQSQLVSRAMVVDSQGQRLTCRSVRRLICAMSRPMQAHILASWPAAQLVRFARQMLAKMRGGSRRWRRRRRATRKARFELVVGLRWTIQLQGGLFWYGTFGSFDYLRMVMNECGICL